VSLIPSARRADIDWIRVGAFGLLILYHVGLVYAPWDWHVHSPKTFEPLRYAALITNPWRLTLLFFVSGAALRLMSGKMTPRQVLRARLARLLPPFLFGVLVLVPPQSWIEAMEKGTWNQGLFAWWWRQFSPQGVHDGVPLNHLWFVLYIGVYSLAAIALLIRPTLMTRLEAGAERALGGWRLLVVPILYLTLVRQGLFAKYGLSNHLDTDWYNHAMSFAVFALGFLTARNAQVWTGFERLRWPSLAVALCALPSLMILEATDPNAWGYDGWVQNAVYAVDQWATLAAVLGFGSRHLRAADGPALRYLTQAVFPCYLAHQTLLVIAAHLTKAANLPVVVQAPLLVIVTLGGSLMLYEGVRRVNWLRPVWGLKPLRARAAVAAAQNEPRPPRAEAA
jgi:surface polysaccharide O-acyltransferase-like enzyme